jgi:hypothetical protein
VVEHSSCVSASDREIERELCGSMCHFIYMKIFLCLIKQAYLLAACACKLHVWCMYVSAHSIINSLYCFSLCKNICLSYKTSLFACNRFQIWGRGHSTKSYGELESHAHQDIFGKASFFFSPNHFKSLFSFQCFKSAKKCFLQLLHIPGLPDQTKKFKLRRFWRAFDWKMLI